MMNDTETRQNETSEIPKKRRSRVKLIVTLAALALVIAFLITVRIVGGALSPDGVRRTWTVISGSGDVSFAFESGFDDVFVDLEGAIAASGSSGVIVYGSDGNELARDAFPAQNPAIATGAGIAVAYDIGGKSVRIVDATGIVGSLTFEDGITSCSVGSTGGMMSGGAYFAVCTQSAGEYKGHVSLYRISGGITESVYEWSSGEGYVLSASIAPGNDSFAVLTLSQRGGRVVLYDRDSTTLKGEYVLPGAAILEMAYMKSGALIARSADALISIDPTGVGTVIYEFDGRTVAGYSHDGDQILAIYYAGSPGGDTSAELVVADERGRELGRMRTSRTMVWLSASGDRIAVLWSDGLDIYDRGLKLIASYPDASGMTRAYPRGGDRAVAMGSSEGTYFSGK